MARDSTPKLFLVPEFTELEWVIADALSEWAEVATYDPPGVGGEPFDELDVERVERGELRVRDVMVQRGLDELDRLGWERFFLVSDAWGNAIAAELAVERSSAVQGIAMGHASLTLDMDGPRPVVSREIWSAMRQVLQNDHRDFIRYAIVQMTHGSVTEEAASAMLERFPDGRILRAVWDALPSEPAPIGERLRKVGRPLLLAQHVDCLSFTAEGFEDAIAAFPDAQVVRAALAPGSSSEFARALRSFCEGVLRSEQALRAG